jgi:hypothetical protein
VKRISSQEELNLPITQLRLANISSKTFSFHPRGISIRELFKEWNKVTRMSSKNRKSLEFVEEGKQFMGEAFQHKKKL